MGTERRLPPESLQRSCRPEEIPYDTTGQARAFEGVIGQERAVDALRFGIGIRQQGYNLFAIGPPGVGKQTLLRRLLDRQAAGEQVPPDWCCVQNFADPGRPRVMELPPGLGARFERDMAQAVAELRVGMRAAFESEEYRTRRQQLVSRFKERQERAFSDIQERAKPRGVAVVHTDDGLVIAPLRDGQPLDADKFSELPEEERNRRKAEMEKVGEELHAQLRTFHLWGREHHEALKALDREIAAAVARRVLDAVRKSCAASPVVLEHLAQVELDVIETADEFLQEGAEGIEAAVRQAMQRQAADGASFRRYRVNLLVDNSRQHGAPVIYEDNPTYANLIGRIEHESQFGALVTHFTLIKAGAFHRANGGYLILDALKVLQNPLAWEAVKRTARSGQVRMDSLAQQLGLVSTVSLEPDPIPFRHAKILLLGERDLYYLLAALDPEFLELFKVVVDFEEQMDRKPERQADYANLLAALVTREGLRPFDRGAVARAIDYAARSAGDAQKLSVHMRGIVDLLREADYWAGEARRDLVTAADVQRAIDAGRHRGARVRDRLLEAIRREDVLIATAGECVGQVNGLAVFQLGEHLFGHPTRITAQVRLGKGEVVDIEREVELGGPLHSKGVLILGGFLGARFATRFPLALSATLVFEQSYGAIEGDSASLAELCALFSAIAEVPARQALAVTGSVNQRGQVQSIGAVNEKIEGFFEVCAEAGLTGEQGVLIPRSNVKNLMLRREVAAAVQEGRFHVYAVEHVDEALELLTGKAAGARDGAGRFPEGSLNALAEARLASFAEAARAFQGKATPG